MIVIYVPLCILSLSLFTLHNSADITNELVISGWTDNNFYSYNNVRHEVHKYHTYGYCRNISDSSKLYYFHTFFLQNSKHEVSRGLWLHILIVIFIKICVYVRTFYLWINHCSDFKRLYWHVNIKFTPCLWKSHGFCA
jgi:hypothetical protein